VENFRSSLSGLREVLVSLSTDPLRFGPDSETVFEFVLFPGRLRSGTAKPFSLELLSLPPQVFQDSGWRLGTSGKWPILGGASL